MESAFSMHEGETLIREAGQYPTLLDVVLEGVQNAIDKMATVIRLTINYRSRNMTLRDNGNGVTREEFERALQSVGHTIKRDDKLGRFGLGLVSPLGKCESFTFTSTPRTDPSAFIEWTFVTEDLRSQRKISGIPLRKRNDVQYAKDGGGKISGRDVVDWRTEVAIHNFARDRFVSSSGMNVDVLRDAVVEKFGVVMRRNDVVIAVTLVDHDGNRNTTEIVAPEFSGIKLSEVTVESKKAGKCVFRLFLARRGPKGRRAGKVLVGIVGDDFRFGFDLFANSLPADMRPNEEAIQALASGLFEGEIVGTWLKLHANRKSFEVNEELAGFCGAISEWFETVGKEHYREAKDARAEERMQELGLRSLRVIEEMMRNPACDALKKVIASFNRGIVGAGHAPKGRGVMLTSLKSLRAILPSSSSGSNGSGGTGSPSVPKDDHPLVAAGPRGQRRKSVKSTSLGLTLVHEPLGGERLWVLDAHDGVLTLNTRHPVWVECDERGDSTVMRFQEFLILEALSTYTLPEMMRESVRANRDEMSTAYAFLLIHGDSIAGRGPGRPRKDQTGRKATTKKVRSLALTGKR